MKITFQSHSENRIEQGETNRGPRSEKASRQNYGKAYEVCMSTKADKRFAKPRTLSEVKQAASQVDVSVQQDYMTLLSNTMSQEDYAKLSEEGFRYEDMDPKTAVTIVDKIKAELVRSGQHIAGYTDDCDEAALSEALGSEALARALLDSFSEADLPMSEDIAHLVKQAWDMTKELMPLSEGVHYYMLDNGKAPTIQNLYFAQNSGAINHSQGQTGYFAEDVRGYYAQNAEMDDVNQEKGSILQAQIEKVIEQAGLPMDTEVLQEAGWILEQGLPLTPEVLTKDTAIRAISFPVTEGQFAQAVANAVAEGKSPMQADFSVQKGRIQKAVDITIEALNPESYLGRRVMEEVRLRMTAEVNLRLLDSGFSIDTAPMEELIEAIKKAEAELADAYFPGDEQPLQKYESYRSVTDAISEIPSLPVQLIGTVKLGGTDATSLMTFHQEGKVLKAIYDQANERYETMRTLPRGDLGDSLRKAFANVDDILTDMQLDISEENRRAIRILGYNRMDMTLQNVEQVKNADACVRSVIEKLTPAMTLQLIRDGVNPLEKSFEELQTYFEEQQGSFEEQAESYSRFLYRLENKGELSKEEREGFIGIYRLIRQLDKLDGAATGAVVNTHANLNFANLLTAVRTNKYGHIDIKATDSFGAVEELIRKGESISDQIAKAFIEDSRTLMTQMSSEEDIQQAYLHEQWEQWKDMAAVREEAVSLLNKGQLPASVTNLVATEALLANTEGPLGMFRRKYHNMTKVSEMGKKDLQLWKGLDNKESFGEHLNEAIEEEMQEIEQNCIDVVDSVMDVRELRLMHKQLSIAGALTQAEEYFIPMSIGGEMSKVHLSFEHNAGERGGVHISVDMSQGEHMEAHLQFRDNRLQGFFVGNTEADVMQLRKATDIFIDSVKTLAPDITVTELPILGSRQVNGVSRQIAQATDDRGETGSLDNKQLYGIAKKFLEAIS